MSSASRVAWAVSLSVSSLWALPAFAEVGVAEKAAAEALFDDGLRSMKSGDYTTACPKLESSQRIDPAVGTLLYLGECYDRVGRTASAWATFREAASTAQATGQLERAKTAQARAARIQGELAYLFLEVAPESRKIPGLVVRRSGAQVSSDLFGVASPADPGEVEIEATAPGYATFVTRTTVVARSTSRVQVPLLAKNPEAPLVAGERADSRVDGLLAVDVPIPTSKAVAASPGGDPLRPLAYVLGAVGIVGVGVGSFFGLRAVSKNSDAEELCPDNVCRPGSNGLELTNQAKDAAVISNISFGVGAGALVAGIVVFALTPSRREAALNVTPVVGSHGAALAIHGRL